MKAILYYHYYYLRYIVKILSILISILLLYNFIPMQKGPKTFYLPDASIHTLIEVMKEHGYGVSLIDHLMLSFHKAPPVGWYTLEETPTQRFALFSNIGKYHIEDNTSAIMSIKLFGGETSVELSGRLANDLKLDHLKLLIAFQKRTFFMEGDLLAGRYSIARDAKEEATIASLFYRSNKQFEAFIKQHYQKPPKEILQTKKFQELLTIASIIQKESYHTEEMPLISSVIYNRLKKDMRLQMDGTLNYGKYSRQKITSERLKTDTSAYNSYKHKGLPPTPLCTVTLPALTAAVAPTQSDYLYFMLTKKGTHAFSVTYKEHLQKIREFKKPKQKTKRVKKDTNQTKGKQ